MQHGSHRRASLYAGAVPAWQVPLADVVVPEDDVAAVADVYRSGWLSMGPRTAEFERALAEYTGAGTRWARPTARRRCT